MLNDTSAGKSLRVEDPVYPDKVRFILNGKDSGSVISTLNDFVSVTVAPPAERPVIDTEISKEPAIKVDPLIIPVAELIDSPGGSPVAEKEPSPA